MTLPKISVITVSFNQGEFIRQNIESVLAQNYENFEHLIIDGGSTDNTLEILRQYPHLKWTSKPDRGQSDALNQGFERAEGDIIAWLNSDDWYAPGIFHEVARELQNCPVLMGKCQEADRAGRPGQIFDNESRSWYDILKYWIYYSIPAQPSIFFTRELLRQCRRADGSYLDETLEFGMDLDLWLRMASHHPFHCRLPRVLSFARMYETNKTGQNMAAAYAEYTRVFRRYEAAVIGSERKIAFIIPLDEQSQDLQASLESIAAQNLRDYEILLVSFSREKKFASEVKRQVIDLSGRYPHLGLRRVVCEEPDYTAAVNAGLAAACAPISVLLPPGSTIDADFALSAVGLFQNDAVGVAFASNCGDSILKRVNDQTVFDWRSLAFDVPIPHGFAIRTAACRELDGLHGDSYDGALRQLMLRALFKGWQVSIDKKAAIRGCRESGPLGGGERDRLICELFQEYKDDPMAERRLRNGFGVMFTAEEIEAAIRRRG